MEEVGTPGALKASCISILDRLLVQCTVGSRRGGVGMAASLLAAQNNHEDFAVRSANRQPKQAFGHAMIHGYQSWRSCGYPIRGGDHHPFFGSLFFALKVSSSQTCPGARHHVNRTPGQRHAWAWRVCKFNNNQPS